MKTVYLLSEYRPHGSSLLIIWTAIKNLPPCHSFTVQFFLLLYFRHCTNCFHVIHSLFNFFLDSVQISLGNKHSVCGRAAYTVQVRMDVFRALWTFITMVVKGHWRQEGQGIWGQPAGNPYWKFSVFWVSFLLNFWVFFVPLIFWMKAFMRSFAVIIPSLCYFIIYLIQTDMHCDLCSPCIAWESTVAYRLPHGARWVRLLMPLTLSLL